MATDVTLAVTGNRTRTGGDLEILFGDGVLPEACNLYASVSAVETGLLIRFTSDQARNPTGVGQVRLFNRLTKMGGGSWRLHSGIRGKIPLLRTRTVARHEAGFCWVLPDTIFIPWSEVTKR